MFFDVAWYICYPHFGKHGDNEHFHIFVPATDGKGRDRIRKRVKDNFGAGNKFVSVVGNKNGITQAIQYGSKEGTEPTTRGDVQSWIDNAPPWIPGAVTQKKRKRNRTHEDSDGEYEVGITVNKYNISDLAARFYKRKKLSFPYEQAWRKTVTAMIASGKFSWYFQERVDPFHELNFLILVGLDTPEKFCDRLLGCDLSNVE